MICLIVPPFLHQPTRRLGAEPNAEDERNGGDESRSELQSPGDGASIDDSKIGASPEEDATWSY